MRRTFLLGIVTISALALACSSKTSSSDPGVTADQACTDFTSNYCDQINKCAPFFVSYIYGDAATCKSRSKINCPKIFDANGTSSTPSKADTCAKSIGALSCSDLLSGVTPAGCGTDPGKLADGTACGDGAQCVSTFCSKKASVCGVCATKPTSGATCKEDYECGTELSCQGHERQRQVLQARHQRRDV